MANYVSKHSGATIDAAVDSINNLVPFSGATVNADGSKGLVPVPVIGDQGKFLRGDGTWQAVSDGMIISGHTLVVSRGTVSGHNLII